MSNSEIGIHVVLVVLGVFFVVDAFFATEKREHSVAVVPGFLSTSLIE